MESKGSSDSFIGPCEKRAGNQKSTDRTLGMRQPMLTSHDTVTSQIINLIKRSVYPPDFNRQTFMESNIPKPITAAFFRQIWKIFSTQLNKSSSIYVIVIIIAITIISLSLSLLALVLVLVLVLVLQYHYWSCRRCCCHYCMKNTPNSNIHYHDCS